MFLWLSKSFDFFLAPLSWAVGLLLAAILVRAGGRARQRLSWASLATLLIFSSQPVANWLATTVESTSGTFRAGAPYDVVIVLGGTLDAEATRVIGRPQFHEGAERILAAADLLRTGAAKEALMSGGLIAPMRGVSPEAQVLKEQLVRMAIPGERIWVEDQSRNTRENAVDSRPIIAAHGWKRLLLVTSAAHMPRAAGCFREVGLEVDTYPVHYHLAFTPSGIKGLFPRAGNLAQSSDLLRELAGRWVYRAMGYTRP